MSELQNFLSGGGDAALRRINNQAESAGSLFADASWDKIGKDKDLTDFLHLSLDPNGSKYNGNSDALKEDLLNTTTAKNSSVLGSIWDFAKSTGENTQKRRFENLVSRLYEDAPNRLFSGNANDTYQAVKSGLLGGAVYDAPLLLATAGIGNAVGLSTKGLAAAGKTLLGESAAKLAATDLGIDAVGQATQQLGRDAVMTGLKRGAIREGAENAAFGVGGDVAQQGANMNRGNQDEFNTFQLVTAGLLGGGIGAVAGGIGGGFEGRALAKELTGELPGAAGKIVADKAAADAAAAAAAKGTETDPNFVALSDAHRNAKANLQDAAEDVTQFINRVTAGVDGAKSQYTPDQLTAIRSALIDARNSSELSESLRSHANALRAATPDGKPATPEAIAKAGELEQRATAYESLIKHIDTIKFEHPEAVLVNGDISPDLVSGLAGFNPKLAAALGEKEAAGAAPTAAGKATAQTRGLENGSVGEPRQLPSQVPDGAVDRFDVTHAGTAALADPKNASVVSAYNQTQFAQNPDGSTRRVGRDHFESWANSGGVTSDVGSQYDGHGIAKGNPLGALLNILENGINRSRRFDSAPLTPASSAAGAGSGLGSANGAYKDGPFILLGARGKSILDGIKTVLVSDEVAASIPALQQRFPDVRFVSHSNAQAVLSRDANVQNPKAAASGTEAKAAPIEATAPAPGNATTTDAVPGAGSADLQANGAAPVRAEAAPPPPPQTPTAKDVATMAETKFTDDEKAAYATLNEALGKANMVLQDALTSMETHGQSQVVADVSKAAGVDRGTVQEAMQTVTAATQREYNKAVAEHDANVVAAKEKAIADAAANLNKAGSALKAAADQVASQAPVTNVEVQAVAQASEAAIKQIEALAGTVTETKALLQYEKIKASLDGQIGDVSAALDAALGNIKQEFDNNMKVSNGDKDFSKLSKESKVAIVKQTLKDLKEKFPDCAPLIDQLDETKLTSKQGVERAKLKLRELAEHSISWTYAKAIGDVLPDPLDAGSFDSVLQAVLSAAPEAEVARISKDYRKFVKDALIERINAIGLKAAMADKDLGPAWQRILLEEGGSQKFGGMSTVAGKFDIVAMAHSYTSEIISEAGKAGVSMADTLREGLPAMVKVGRDIMRMLRASGIPMDSKFMEEAIHARLKAAVREVVDRDFYKQNEGDFKKLAALRELRGSDMTRNETQSLNRNRMQGSSVGNPVITRIYNNTGEGNWLSRNVMVTGRKQLRDKNGNLDISQPQSLLSDGISDYLGTLWAHPRKMFAAASMARDAIYTGAVDAASWMRGAMVIDGTRVSGSLKELKGLYKEQAAARIAQSRWSLILDAAERRRLPETDPRALPGDQYKAQVERIGQISNPVTEAEQNIAELFLDSRARIVNEKAVAQKSMAEVLARSKEMGTTDSAKINAIIDRLNSILEKNEQSTIKIAEQYGLASKNKASERSRSTVVRDANGNPVLDADGKVVVAKEGAEKGTAAKELNKPLPTGNDASIANGGRVMMIVKEDGTVVPGSRDDGVVIVSIKGVKREVSPGKAITMEKNGDVKLYGEKVGTWSKVEGADHSVMVVAKGVEEGIKVQDFTKLVIRDAFRKAHNDIFERHAKKATEASEATASLPDGAQVSVEQSNTAAVKAAVDQIQHPGKLADADLDKTMDSFAAQDGFILVMKSARGPEAKSPGPRQGNMTVRAFAKLIGISPDDVRIGYIEEKLLKSGELRGKSANEKLNYPGIWTPIGSKLPTADSNVVAQVIKRKENAPMVLEAQNRPISLTEAEEIVFADGQNLANLYNQHRSQIMTMRFAGTLDELNAGIQELRAIAEKIDAIAPHGIKQTQASRATSFVSLQRVLAGYPQDELNAALDMLRRMDSTGRGLPEFHPGTKNELFITSMDKGTSQIKLTTDAAGVVADAGLPKHVVVAHEVGHWGFYNLLTPTEQVRFLEGLTKFYDESGKLDPKKIFDEYPAIKKLEAATKGVRFIDPAKSSTNEIFAWGFSNHVLRNMSTGAATDGLWGRVVKLVKNVLSHFLEGKVDPDMAPLFEKIMPSTISDTKYNYSSFLERSTGKVGDIPDFGAKTNKVGEVIMSMRKIDELRGKLRQHLFIPGAVADVGFAEDLRFAAKHMFGFLYGRDSVGTIARVRAKLNPFERVPKEEAIASGKKDEWLRGKDGSVVKSADEKGELHGVHLTKLRAGMVDHTQLFSRTDKGKLIQAINDAMPAEAGAVADQIAFEAVEASEKFKAITKDTSVGGNPFLDYAWHQALQQEFKRLTGLEMDKTPATAAAKYSEALDKAVKFAYEQAEELSKSDLGVDIHDSLFDQNGAVMKLGTDQQREVLAGVARSLHDLMSDALTYMETAVRYKGIEMKAVDRVVERPPVEVSKAAEPEVAKRSRKRAEKTVAPKTEKGVEVATAEAKERVDGAETGAPVAADPQIQAVVARVPHRDPEQAGVIGAAMTRIIRFIQRGDELTNGDIARITGVALDDGYKAEAMVNSTTEAFDAFRKGLRWVSENMTGVNGKPKVAMDYVADLLLRDRMDTIINDVGADVIHGNKLVPITEGFLRGELARVVRGEPVDDMLKSHLNDILIDTTHILSGLGKTAEAKRVAGPTVATPERPRLALADGTYHHMFAKAGVASRLRGLPQRVADQMVELLGLPSSGDTARTLSENIAYRISGSRNVFDSSASMMNGAERAAAKVNGLSELDMEIGNAIIKKDAESVDRLLRLYEANSGAPGVIPVFVDMSKVYDQAAATPEQQTAVNSLVESGKFKTHKDAAKSLGYIGYSFNGKFDLFSMKSAREMEQVIASAVGSAKPANVVGDAPLSGEISLGLLGSTDARPNPLALEQRSILAGAPKAIAEIISRPFKAVWDKAPLTAEETGKVRAHWGIQLSSNSARIRKVGGQWLADLIAPEYGTGFEESFTTKLSTRLQPLVKTMDKLALTESRWLNNWVGKSAYEVYRNLDFRHHAIPQSSAEARIAMAMRTGDESILNAEERMFKSTLNKHFREMLQAQHDAGIPVADVTDAANPNYLPQRFNLDWIRHNRDDAIDRMTEFFEKDRRGSHTVGDARADATRVINEAINREELQGVLDGASSTYTQAFGDKLHQRKLHIVGKDWERMHPLFDNNLRSLTTAYTETATKRIEWANTFGVRGHAAATYTDIAERGANAAMDALMGKAGGMKRVLGRPGSESDLVGKYAAMEAQKEIEAVESLFSAATADPATAAKLVKEVMDTLDQNKDIGTRARMTQLLTDYHTKNGGFGEAEFAKRAAAIVNGLADFGENGSSVARTDVNFMRSMVGTLGGRPAYTISANQGMRDMAGAIKSFNSVTLLSTAVLSSLADPAMSLMRSGSIRDWMNGMTSSIKLAMNDQAYVDAMYRVGVTMESVIHENLSNMSGGLVGRFNNAYFNANLLTPWTNAQRQMAALVGYESIRSNQNIVLRERMVGNMDSWQYRKSMKYLRELGLGFLATSEKLGEFPVAVQNAEVAKAIHKFTNEAVFQPNRNDMPLWTQDPIASIMWQFKSYPTMMGRLAKKNVKDAFSFDSAGKYDGDPMGLAYLLSVGAAFGLGAGMVKDTVLGKNSRDNPDNPHSPRTHSISKMMQDLGYKDFDLGAPGADVVMGSAVQGLLNLGAMGFVGDLLVQSAKSLDNGAYGRERIMSQIFGPTVGTFSDLIQIAEGAKKATQREEGQEFGSSEERTAVRKLVSRIPVAGRVDPWVETFVNATAGPLENPPQQ